MSNPAKQSAARSSDTSTDAPTSFDSESPTSRDHEVPSSRRSDAVRAHSAIPASATNPRVVDNPDPNCHDTIPSPPPDDFEG